MAMRRFRIVDLLAAVALAALAATLTRDLPAEIRLDWTLLACPPAVSLTLAMLMATIIAAKFGREAYRPRRWGFVLGCGAYLMLSLDLGWFDGGVFSPAPRPLMVGLLGAAGSKAGTLGWTSAHDWVQGLRLIRGPIPYL